MLAVPVNFVGGAKRHFPSGGSAYGMPRYSLTLGDRCEGWPLKRPLVVFTTCPMAANGDHARTRKLLGKTLLNICFTTGCDGV